MAESLFEFGWQPAAAKDDKIYGVAIATVVENLDSTGEARVKVRLPWAPGFEPWARIATMMAGMSRGRTNQTMLSPFLAPSAGRLGSFQ